MSTNAAVHHLLAGQFVGDTLPLRFSVLKPDDAAKDLTSATLKWGLYNAAGAEVLNQDSAGVTVQVDSPATDGIVTILISKAATTALPAGTYYDELEVTDGNDRRRTVAYGYIELREQKVV